MCEQTVIDSLENLKSIHRQRQGLLNKIKNVEEKLEELKEESEYSRPRGLDGTLPEYEEGFESDEEPFLTEYDAENGPKRKAENSEERSKQKEEAKKGSIWDTLLKIGIIVVIVAIIVAAIVAIVYFKISITNLIVGIIVLIIFSPLWGPVLVAAGAIVFTPVYIVYAIISLIVQGIYYSRNKKYNKCAPKEYYDAHYTQRLAAHRQDVEKYQREEKERQKKISALENELELLGVRQATIDAVIDADPCLPSRYKEYPTVTKLLDYLKNMRADSIKEAINLYESEEMQKDHTRRVMRAEAERNAYIKAAAEAQQQAAYEAELQRIAAQSMADDVAKQRRAAEDALDEIRDMRKQMDD